MTTAWLPDAFAATVLDWFAQHGRKDLPWQREPTPYRVWVSEIMLQQTQVAVVIPYFECFIARFPTLHALARADLDDVLRHWAGLGYYARARNLHHAAREIEKRHGGEFPQQLDSLMALPGIGRSTAGAVLSLAGGQAHAILDGNVKRVLARCFAVSGWPGQSAVQHRLWVLADELLAAAVGLGPRGDWPGAAAYNQGMMDIGATLCTRGAPRCTCCPLSRQCLALASDQVRCYPKPKPKRSLPRRATRWLLVQDAQGNILLERRPASGIWGGLWTLPEAAMDEDFTSWCERHLGAQATAVEKLADRRHTFSHFALDIHPVRLRFPGLSDRVADDDSRVWLSLEAATKMAVPAPLKRLLLELSEDA
ncbi:MULTISPECIES: A/G-specific adenine glycosylase [Thiorhodovibrio]|uniref:A/G-specific adenine glycosylase n=1 Tax=Thiorhodovibrio TaxID=61593 RepID=UPI0019124855|nr:MULTISPECIES: A/G-specific adenine glycosylase [Thiorhodovibrio]MBK5971080.1 A/G-specific adenine glycosylase [Thiorhodovibrio winogradskyi]WPL10553.1 A/G-specific adenine glycosylase [Thiorhodovibrio litoralis]